ncbi:hypothetical protein KW801_02330, partial [Candidatus Saccharibacteria bacterium]|nr:hypothetical protein [Candidatus Saccharibacteria bacterium]
GIPMKKWLTKNALIAGVAGTVVGILVLLVIRFFTYNPPKAHYHANFVVYINGQREQFKEPFYYEEAGAACTAEGNITPQDRAHMHDNVNDVVHVHDHAVTWGQFFQNLGWYINPRFINTPTQLLLADDSHKVTFLVNGQAVPNIANQVIGDRDRLLVDYGNEADQDLQNEFKSVASTALKYDTNHDPASCSGSTPVTTHDRLTHLF